MGPIIKMDMSLYCILFSKSWNNQDIDIAGADLGYASDSDIDPLGGVHRGAGHCQGHRVQ